MSIDCFFSLSTNAETLMSQCNYAYLSQPPTEVSCMLPENVTVLVHCDVVSLASRNFTVNWYREGEIVTNATIAFLRQTLNFNQTGVPIMHYHLSRLFITPNALPGRYYCQIEATDNSTDIEFAPSNVLYLRERELYQNQSSCNSTDLLVRNETCAHNFTVMSTELITEPPTQFPVQEGFPRWGYAIAMLVPLLIVVIALFIVNVCACAKIRQRHLMENFKETNVDYDLASVQESTSTDHTYEELDVDDLDAERPQPKYDQHEPKVEINLSYNIHQDSCDPQIIANPLQHCKVESFTQQHTDIGIVPEQSMLSSSWACTPQAEIEARKSDKISEGYDKLFAGTNTLLQGKVMIKDQDTKTNEDLECYDHLNSKPKIEVNLSYNIHRDSCDPQTIANPSYREAEPFTVKKNDAYNIKRDELDPITRHIVLPAVND